MCVNFVGLIRNNYITMHGEKNLKILCVFVSLLLSAKCLLFIE